MLRQPCAAANSNGVFPSSSATVGSAPASSNAVAIGRLVRFDTDVQGGTGVPDIDPLRLPGIRLSASLQQDLDRPEVATAGGLHQGCLAGMQGIRIGDVGTHTSSQ